MGKNNKILDDKALTEKWSKNPRAELTDKIKSLEELRDNLVKILKTFPDLTPLFFKIMVEYSSLVSGIGKKINIIGIVRTNNVDIPHILQKADEQSRSVIEWHVRKDSVSALRVGRAYASSYEVYTKKIKTLINLAGLNPKQKYLNKEKLTQKLDELETTYNTRVPTLKSFTESQIRNSVNHDSFHFEEPDILVFKDVNGKTISTKKIEDVMGMISELKVVTIVLSFVESIILRSHLVILNDNLTDGELEELLKTGKLSEETQKKLQLKGYDGQ